MAAASQILVLGEIYSLGQLSPSPLLIPAASPDLDIELSRLKTQPPCPCIPPSMVSDKPGAVENWVYRMSLIDTNAEVSTNGRYVLRSVLCFFF